MLSSDESGWAPVGRKIDQGWCSAISDALGETLVVDEAWEEFEIGRLTERAFCCHLRQSCGLKLSDVELIQGWNSIYIGINGEVERLLREVVDEGVRVVAVTNTNVSPAFFECVLP